PNLRIAARTGDLASAASAIRSGEAIAAIYIPANFERDVKAERRPQVVGFYNQQYLTAAGIASAGLGDSLSAAAATPAPPAAGAHRISRCRDDRAGQSAEKLRAVPAPHAVADDLSRGHRACRRLRGRLRVPATQRAHVARLRGWQSGHRPRGQARPAVRDLLPDLPAV